MKKINTSWKASKRPGKQRKYRVKAPLHLKRKLMGANLSKELRKKYGRRSIPLRKGDVVKIMRGKFKKKTGKVLAVDTKKLRIEIEGIQMKKQDGSKSNVRFYPSILQITELNTEDKKRIKNAGKETKSVTNKEEKKNAS